MHIAKAKKSFSVLAIVFMVTALFGNIPPSQAALTQAGPVDPVTTFPVWYQDENGLTLELMDGADPNGISAPVDDGTTFDPDGNPIPANPFSAQIGFGAEGFWFSADADMPTNGGGQALLIEALEAAFAPSVTPIDGLQAAFMRIRIRIDVTDPGAYTVTFPYGQKTYNVATPGTRAINDTVDIGCFSDPAISFRCDTALAPNDFSAALTGDIGPFVTWDTFDTDPALSDPLLFDAATGRRYIGTALAAPHAIKGSPTGNNFFRVEGPNIGGPGIDIIETDLFTVTGRLAPLAPADTVAPVITMNGVSPVDVTVGTPYVDAGATATDNVDPAVTVDAVSTVDTNTLGVYTVTYTATDLAGNAAVPVVRTVNVVAEPVVDVTPPVITINGVNPVEVIVGTPYVDAGATATDNVDPTVAVDAVSIVDSAVIGTYTVTYTASDVAGNAAVPAVRTVNVVADTPPADTTPPDIAILGANPVTLTVGDVYADAGATAVDDVSGDITANITASGLPVDTGTAGTYTVVYTVSDAAGNPASAARTVHVFDPVLGSSVSRSFSTAAPLAGAPLTVSLAVNLVAPDSFYIIDEVLPAGWAVTDPGTGDVSQAGHIKWAVLTGAVPVINQYTVAVPEIAVGAYAFSGEYSFDSSPAPIVIAGQTGVDVVPMVPPADTVPPVITLIGPAVMEVVQGSVFSDPGATVADNADPSPSLTVTGTVDTSVIGAYVLVYDAIDAALNAAAPVERTVNVVAAPPVSQVDSVHVDPDLLNLHVGDTWQFGAEARDIDNAALDPQPSVVWSMKNNDTTVGNIDASGLFTASANGTATVVATMDGVSGEADVTVGDVEIPDNTPPVLAINGDNPAMVVLGSVYQDDGASAQDAVDGDLTSAIVVTVSVNTAAVGDYTVNYTVEDATGNSSSATRTVKVVECLEPVMYYADTDGDGYGNAGQAVQACALPEGYAENSGDCDDSNDVAHPGGTEIDGNGIDDDCNAATLDDDRDDDNVADDDDAIEGNAADMDTNFTCSLKIEDPESGGNLINPANFSGTSRVRFDDDDNKTHVEFDYNFSGANALNLPQIKILADEDATTGSIVVSGINLGAGTKTVYLSKKKNTGSICVKDAEVASASFISGACNTADETIVPCDGVSHMGYVCSAVEDGARYKVTGLRHSAVREFAAAAVSTPAPAATGGGGGGGGGFLIPRHTTTDTTRSDDVQRQIDRQLEIEREAREGIEVRGVEAERREIELAEIEHEAEVIHDEGIDDLLKLTGAVRNSGRENEVRGKFVNKLILNANQLSDDDENAIANFIAYGTANTKKLGEGERAGVLDSYKAAYGKLPTTKAEWNDVLKIAIGRFPGQANANAEARAKAEFKKIYLHDANMLNEKEKAAVNVMAYGLRPNQRNLNSERAAINIFKGIFKANPTSAMDWDKVRAISYSGATR